MTRALICTPEPAPTEHQKQTKEYTMRTIGGAPTNRRQPGGNISRSCRKSFGTGMSQPLRGRRDLVRRTAD